MAKENQSEFIHDEMSVVIVFTQWKEWNARFDWSKEACD